MKKQVKEQRRVRAIKKLEKGIRRTYARMALEQVDPYFGEINHLTQQMNDLGLCACEIFENLAIYAFVCAAYEHYNSDELMDDWQVIRPDKGLRCLQTAVWDLEDLGWPAPGHTQFWDWVAELRRRRSEYLNSKHLPERRLNPWEWVVKESDWEKFGSSFDQGEISDETGTDQFVIGYYGDEEEPVVIRRQYGVWVANRFGNAGWRDVTIISTGWRSPAAADWDLKRSPRQDYIGKGWYNGPGTEPDMDG